MSWALIQNTLLVGIGSTLIAMVFGVMVAITWSSLDRLGRNTFMVVALITLALPPFLLTNTWTNYLGEAGAWRDWFPLDLFTPAGAILILSLWLWPVIAFAVWGAWQRLEPAHLEAEPDLRGWKLIRWLLLPLARGAVVIAGLATFVLAANNLAVPALLQVNVYPAEVWLSFSSTFWVTRTGDFDWARALSLSWPVVVLPLAVIFALACRSVTWPTLRGEIPAGVFRSALGPVWVIAAFLATVVLAFFSAGLPLWQIVGASQTWIQLPDAVSAGKSAIFNSFAIPAIVATLCVALAVLSAVRVGGRKQQPAFSEKFIGNLLWLPFLVPGVLIGIALIQLLNRPITAWLYQSLGIVVLALAIRYLGIGWEIARHAVRSTDSDLADAARLDGASKWQLFRHVLWPQIAPQLAAAWCIVFLLCLWDVETLVLIIPPGGETVALRVFNMLHYGHTAHVNALCLVLLGLAVAPLILVAALVKARTLCSSRKNVHTFTSVATAAAGMLACAGCSPKLASNEARVESQVFDRVQIIATRGVAPGQVNKPRSVTVDHDDNLYVLDYTGRVQKFSPSGEFLMFWQMPETKRGNPKGLSVDREGNIIVVEPHYFRVNLFTPEGELLMQWGERGTNAGQFTFPRSAVVNSKQEWFVSEFGVVDRIQKFAFEPGEHPELRHLATYGHAGAGPGGLNRAEGLFVDAEDHLLVADAVNHRIQTFDTEGNVLNSYGSAGSGVGELSYPYDVCEDMAGRQYVCEFGNSRIQIFDSQGHSLEILGGPGAAPGFFNNPWGVALDSHGNLYVADSQNHRVQKFIRKAKVTARSTGSTVSQNSVMGQLNSAGDPSEIQHPKS